jgi:hypothetical protein
VGYWFTFCRSKQRNRLEETTICVPRRQKDWLPCVQDTGRKAVDYDPASLIDCYLETVMQDLDCKREELSGCFFKGTHGKSGKRFVKSNIGKNTLALVGVEIASELCLRAPETFTGHCWRRSAGTNASDSGVNVTTLMSMMGWSCPKTAMQYVKRSRITSLKMSMYLANVQRRNCVDPFPSRTVRASRKKTFFEKKDAKKSELSTSGICVSDNAKVCSVSAVSDRSSFENLNESGALEIDKFESEISSQEVTSDRFETADENVVCSSHSDNIAHDIVPVVSVSNIVTENDCTNVVESVRTPVSSASASVDLSTIDSRLLNVLQNLQNHGSIQIHFHFGDSKN